MELLEIGHIRIVSMLTSLCFISAIILKVFNITHINGYYLTCFTIMFFLSIIQVKLNTLEQMTLKANDMYLWGSIFIWDMFYVVLIAFKLERYFIKAI